MSSNLKKTTSFRHNEKDAENIEKAKEYTYQDRAYYLYRSQVSKGDAIRHVLAVFVREREEAAAAAAAAPSRPPTPADCIMGMHPVDKAPPYNFTFCPDCGEYLGIAPEQDPDQDQA